MPIAPEILEKLNEHSSRGFLLFSTSAEGTIDCYCYVDDEITKTAIQAHALKLLSLQDNLDNQLIMNGMISELEAEAKAEKRRRKRGGDDLPS